MGLYIFQGVFLSCTSKTIKYLDKDLVASYI